MTFLLITNAVSMFQSSEVFRHHERFIFKAPPPTKQFLINLTKQIKVSIRLDSVK